MREPLTPWQILWRAVAVVVTAGLLGAAAGSIVRNAPASPIVSASPTRLVSAGDAHLRVPATWQTVSGKAPVPGLDQPPSVLLQSALGYIVITQAPAASASLLPPGTGALGVGTLGRRVRLGSSIEAMHYSGYLAEPWATAPIDLYAIPTTSGSVVVGCIDDVTECRPVIRTLRLSSGRILQPGPGAALASRLASAMAPLADGRRSARAALAHARTAAGRAAAARRLAEVYGGVAGPLAPVAGAAPEARRLVALLARIAADYRRLGAQAGASDARGFNATARAIGIREHALDAALSRAQPAPPQ